MITFQDHPTHSTFIATDNDCKKGNLLCFEMTKSITFGDHQIITLDLGLDLGRLYFMVFSNSSGIEWISVDLSGFQWISVFYFLSPYLIYPIPK